MKQHVSGRLLASAIVVVATIAATAVPAAAEKSESGASHGPSRAAVAASVHCPNGVSRHDTPVLLVHGTGSTATESWGSSFLPVLLAAGFHACTVDVPGREVGDMQSSADWVAVAIRIVAHRADRRIDVIGHSQGGVLPRLAIRLHPDVAEDVDDLVLMAGTQHGTLLADILCAAGCATAVLQQRTSSALLAALNSPHELWGEHVSYTTIRSTTDETVFPSDGSKLAGASNIAVQDICPGRLTSHIGLIFDTVAYAAAIDAITHRGPADAARLSSSLCATAVVAGMDASVIPAASAAAFAAVLGAPPVTVEPIVRIHAHDDED
jgi:pimeloyl-ACP methyl ester carboxylesterase